MVNGVTSLAGIGITNDSDDVAITMVKWHPVSVICYLTLLLPSWC